MSLYSGKGKRLAQGGTAAAPARGGKRLRRSGTPLHRRLLLALGILMMVGGTALLLWVLLWRGGSGEAAQSTRPAVPDGGQGPTQSVQTPLPSPSQPQEEGQSPEREEGTFLLSFAGDCTLGTEHGRWGKSGTFPDVVGEDYSYPFAGVQSLFAGDDFTFVNLECALTNYNVPAEKTFRFRGPPEYGSILTAGSVEGVTLANNHSLDYGQTGLADTRAVLAELGVAAGGDGETFLYTTDRGLKVGVYTAYHISRSGIQQGIEALQAQGAEVIVTAFHTGVEGAYTPTDFQRETFRWAADCGAHIVYNSHPHVLQPVEYYGESVIFYSLGNFTFGGNRNPTDKDTAVLQVSVVRGEDGVEIREVTAHPCSVSGRSDRNDYQPTLYPQGSEGAQRVERKLAGTYRAQAAAPPSQSQEAAVTPTPQETPAATQSPEPDVPPAATPSPQPEGTVEHTGAPEETGTAAPPDTQTPEAAGPAEETASPAGAPEAEG